MPHPCLNQTIVTSGIIALQDLVDQLRGGTCVCVTLAGSLYLSI